MNALLLLGAVVLIFAAICVLRFIDVIRETKEEADAIERWWAERAKYRERANESTDRGPKAA